MIPSNMNFEHHISPELAWFAGLFEGEGTFNFSNGVPRRISISMTDLDVLEAVRDSFGGSIHSASRAVYKEHWKDAWVWNLSGEKAVQLSEAIYPLLSLRRKERANEFISQLRTRISERGEQKDFHEKRKKRMVELRNSGYTIREIGAIIGVDHSYVGKVIRDRMAGVVK